MSFVGGFGGGFGGGPTDGLRFAQTRGRIQGSPVQGVVYPSPFFDIAHTYLPVTVKQMFRWCRYYFLTNPLINATVFKMSEYPITDIVIDHKNSETVNKWTEYLQDHLRYRPFLLECGLDYFVYGNCFVSIGFPFKKYLTCTNCGNREEAKKIRPHWVFTNYAFRLNCPQCHHTSEAQVHDIYFRNPTGIRLIRWNPEDIDIAYNDVSGEYTYFYNIPNTVKNDIVIGKKEAVETTPQIFIQALRQQKGIVFTQDIFFHLRRPTLANQDRGWGIPLLLPVLKDTFYLQLMKKAQEAILTEHILPLRVLFPQPGSGTSDPFTTINLVDWRDHVASEIARWRWDNNYIPILPLPIGHQSIGGDGRALLLTQEMQLHADTILSGMGVPRELVFGGITYTGSNVSLRMLENMFIGYLYHHKRMINWVIKHISNYMDWPTVSARFKPFKMADDIQRKAYLFQLNQASKISDTTLLADADLSQEEEDEIMLRETAKRIKSMEAQQLAMAELQGKQQIVMMKNQAKAQQAMTEAMNAPNAQGEAGDMGAGTSGGMVGAPPAEDAGAGIPAEAQSQLSADQNMQENGQMAGMDIQSVAASIASQLSQVSPVEQHQAIKTIKASSPELADLVLQLLASYGALAEQVPNQMGAAGEAASNVNMQPLPEQRPPRRAAGII